MWNLNDFNLGSNKHIALRFHNVLEIPFLTVQSCILGHSATQGCSRCSKSFPGGIGEKVYGGFDRENWPTRTHETHCQQMREIQQSRSKGDKEDLEKRYGTRYSVLIELPYFKPIQMAIVDPMHNLFLGTAKHMLNLWRANNILDNDKFDQIDSRLQGIEAASDVGKLPTKLVSSYNKFTADEFKNWTLLFSLYALKGVIDDKHFKCWQKFVLACRYLCSRVITSDGIKIADNLLLSFCKSFEKLFGTEKVTPNMHLHGHLSECLWDYGPVYSFWLFSFERYNGGLGGLPNNKRIIEVQIMNRFIRDGSCHNAEFPLEFEEEFSSILTEQRDPKDRGSLVEMTHNTLYHRLKFASRGLSLSDGNWSDLSYMTFKIGNKHCTLSNLEKAYLQSMYMLLYPNSEVHIHISYSSIQHVYVGGELYGSSNSRTRRSSTIMAFWAGSDGEIQLSQNLVTKPRPGLISNFMLHVVKVNGVPLQHLLARVSWYTAIPDHKDYFGNPHEIWYSKLFDMEGPASFLPVQRIKCKFVKIERVMFNKDILVTCPRDRAINI